MTSTCIKPKTTCKVLLPTLVASLLFLPACNETEAAPKAKAPAKATAAKRAGAIRLKLHSFPDSSMGAPSAYTVILPPQWKAQGNVEWQPVGQALFPQTKFDIRSPQDGRIRFQPPSHFSYMEAPGMAPQGTPAPANFPRWLVQAISATNRKVSNVKLVSSRRDSRAEASLAAINRSVGGGNGMTNEVWLIVMDYTEAKVRKRQEAAITYTRFAPYLSQNMNSQMWSMAPSAAISAPINLFPALKAQLSRVANTVRPTPQWHVQSQNLIAEMSRQRSENNWAIIRERGRQIGQASDADYARFKKDMARGDAAQRQRINSINETDDFRDTTGSIVNLPMHYNHVFSDGKGNYVLSNNSGDRPGQQWKQIRPMK